MILNKPAAMITVACIAAVLLAGCQGEESAPKTARVEVPDLTAFEQAQPQLVDASHPEGPGVCDNISIEVLAGVLGGEPMSQSSGNDQCTWTYLRDGDVAVSTGAYVSPLSPEDPLGSIAPEGAIIEPVEGLGDEAIRYNDGTFFFLEVRVGGHVHVVMSTGGDDCVERNSVVAAEWLE